MLFLLKRKELCFEALNKSDSNFLTTDLSRGATSRRGEGAPDGAAERPVHGVFPWDLRVQGVLWL